jgi:hypothetical protein
LNAPVKLPIEQGSLTLDDAGLRIDLRFSRKPVIVPWSNVEFVHSVPAVKRVGSGWKTYRGEDITPESLRLGLRFYVLELALKDRHAVLEGSHLLRRMKIRASLLLKPLWDRDDRPHPKQGCLRVEISRRKIRKFPATLLDALDLIERVSRFDLLITED